MSKVQIGNYTWGSKRAALKAIYEIRQCVNDGQPITGLMAELLTAATDLHADAAQKRGIGISHFTVEPAGKDRCFWLHRWDGSSTDISFRYIFDSPNKQAKDDRIAALRQAIDYQVKPLRRPGYHVHHVVSFDTLMKGWLESEGLTLEQIEVKPTVDGQMRCEMANNDQEASWQRYHHANFVYQYMTPEEHRALKRKP